VNFVLNGAVATTDVIANCLNPIFPPYCRRGFVFPINSTSRLLHIGVFDSDELGGSGKGEDGGKDGDHIGRTHINLSKLTNNTE
jgi:hypothetical protein